MVLAMTVARRVASKKARLNFMVQSDSDAEENVNDATSMGRCKVKKTNTRRNSTGAFGQDPGYIAGREGHYW